MWSSRKLWKPCPQILRALSNLRYSHYADTVPSPQEEAPKLQLVLFQQPAAEDKTVLVSDDLETFDKFVNHRSFHRLSGDQDREARVSAYQDLMNLMLA